MRSEMVQENAYFVAFFGWFAPFRKEIRAVEDRLGRQIQSDRKEEAGYNGVKPLILPVLPNHQRFLLHIRGFSYTVRCSVVHFNQF